MEYKRIFVGGLSSSITQTDLENVFKKFGSVESIDIKSKYDEIQGVTKVFAFVELNITRFKFDSCINSCNNLKLKNCNLTLQPARESIFSRLKRERELAKKNDEKSGEVPKLLPEPLQNSSFSVMKTIKKRKLEEEKRESSGESSDENSNSLSIPEFKGVIAHGLKLKTSQKSSNFEVEKKSQYVEKECRDEEKKSQFVGKECRDEEKKSQFVGNEYRDDKFNVKNLRQLQHDGKIDLNSSSEKSNKIRFHYDDSKLDNNANNNTNTYDDHDSPKMIEGLFDSDSDNDSDLNSAMFRVRSQYEGKKGQKLIALQNKFGNDGRFKMDEKFLESDSEEDASDENEMSEDVDEKQRNLDILQSVLGKELQEAGPQKGLKTLFRDTREIRYDPLNPECQQFEIKVEEKKKEKNLPIKEDVEEINIPSVSTEKFYDISNNLKDKFNEEKEQPFSLLSFFDKGNEKSEHPEEETTYKYESIEKKPIKDISSYKTITEKSNAVVPSLSSKKLFFFRNNDERLKQGINFFVRKENLDKLRDEWSTKKKDYLHIFNARKKQTKRKLQVQGNNNKRRVKRFRFKK